MNVSLFGRSKPSEKKLQKNREQSGAAYVESQRALQARIARLQAEIKRTEARAVQQQRTGQRQAALTSMRTVMALRKREQTWQTTMDNMRTAYESAEELGEQARMAATMKALKENMQLSLKTVSTDEIDTTMDDFRDLMEDTKQVSEALAAPLDPATAGPVDENDEDLAAELDGLLALSSPSPAAAAASPAPPPRGAAAQEEAEAAAAAFPAVPSTRLGPAAAAAAPKRKPWEKYAAQ